MRTNDASDPLFHDASILVSVGVFLTHQIETVGVFAYFLCVKTQKRPLSGALEICCYLSKLASVLLQWLVQSLRKSLILSH